MQTIDVTAELGTIEFSPDTELKEILQNVRCILTTARYSVPLDRGFGIDGQIVDAPMDYAQARLTAEIIDAVKKYEPRARVTRVIFDGDGADGKLVPMVRVEIGSEGY